MSDLTHEIANLRQTRTTILRQRYAQLFGDMPQTGNKTWLVRRIAWRLQALAEGNLSERARKRALELANDADLRLSPPRPANGSMPSEAMLATALPKRRQRPLLDAVLARKYKCRNIQVKVLADGFEFEGKTYGSLSAVAKVITGTHTSGHLFFRLPKQVKHA